jgi:glycerophosphoryl diester phosphodiesterase
VAIQIPVEGGGFDLTNARFIAALKRRNIKLHFWTINEAKQMRELIDAGADGLLTDYVVRANEVVAKSRR